MSPEKASEPPAAVVRRISSSVGLLFSMTRGLETEVMLAPLLSVADTEHVNAAPTTKSDPESVIVASSETTFPSKFQLYERSKMPSLRSSATAEQVCDVPVRAEVGSIETFDVNEIVGIADFGEIELRLVGNTNEMKNVL